MKKRLLLAGQPFFLVIICSRSVAAARELFIAYWPSSLVASGVSPLRLAKTASAPRCSGSCTMAIKTLSGVALTLVTPGAGKIWLRTSPLNVQNVPCGRGVDALAWSGASLLATAALSSFWSLGSTNMLIRAS
jgi:hypothetical protein